MKRSLSNSNNKFLGSTSQTFYHTKNIASPSKTRFLANSYINSNPVGFIKSKSAIQQLESQQKQVQDSYDQFITQIKILREKLDKVSNQGEQDLKIAYQEIQQTQNELNCQLRKKKQVNCYKNIQRAIAQRVALVTSKNKIVQNNLRNSEKNQSNINSIQQQLNELETELTVEQKQREMEYSQKIEFLGSEMMNLQRMLADNKKASQMRMSELETDIFNIQVSIQAKLDNQKHQRNLDHGLITNLIEVAIDKLVRMY